MSAIPPPHLRREDVNQRLLQNLKNTPANTPLAQVFNEAPKTSRLKSRKPFYKSERHNFDITEQWKKGWTENAPQGGHLIDNPTTILPGSKTNESTGLSQTD